LLVEPVVLDHARRRGSELMLDLLRLFAGAFPKPIGGALEVL
jgi:hypothetical protein